MEKIYSKIEPWHPLHIIVRMEDIQSERINVIEDIHYLQLAVMNLSKGKTFRPHKHLHQTRIPPQLNGKFLSNYKTQESWVVIKGKVKCILYDIDDTVIAEPILNAGDASITLNGGHTYEILEDGSIIFEYKTGPYLGQEKDKEFI